MPWSLCLLFATRPIFGSAINSLVGFHFLPLFCMERDLETTLKWVKVAQSCLTLCNPMVYYSLWNSLGQNTGEGSLSLLQGTFSTQGSNPGCPRCRRILYQLSHQGRPETILKVLRRIEWEVTCPTLLASEPLNLSAMVRRAFQSQLRWERIPKCILEVPFSQE